MAVHVGSQRLRERMRQTVAGNLPDTAAIYRPHVGAATDDFGTSATYELLDIVAANWWTITGQEALVLQRMDVRATDTIVLPANTDITETDEIVYTVTETGQLHHFMLNIVYDRSRPTIKKVGAVEYKFDTQHSE